MTSAAGAILCAIGSAVGADDTTQPSLDAYKWEARPIVVFADADNDPRLVRQLAEFDAGVADLDERDVVILVDTDPDTLTPLRKKFRPRDFAVLVIGKDGEVKYRKPNPVTVREVVRLIDRMPMRRQEMEAARSQPSG